jgi:hypothetical protein
LGPSWIVEGEDADLYEQLLAEVAAAVEPADLIDWLLIKDIVALTWEIQRTRRMRDSLMRTARLGAMQSILSSLLFPWLLGADRLLGTEKPGELAKLWLYGDEEATREVQELLDGAGLNDEDVSLRAISTCARELDRLDAQNERHEQRRDALLRQIERRRAGWADKVKRTTDEIIDAEFTSTPGKQMDKKSVKWRDP